MQKLIKGAIRYGASRRVWYEAANDIIKISERAKKAGADRSRKAAIWRNWIAKKKMEMQAPLASPIGEQNGDKRLH